MIPEGKGSRLRAEAGVDERPAVSTPLSVLKGLGGRETRAHSSHSDGSRFTTHSDPLWTCVRLQLKLPKLLKLQTLL